MSAPANTSPGWYPGSDGLGTRYWDGTRWTGDARPPRRAFAARSSHKGWGITLLIVGGLGFVGSLTGAAAEQEASPASTAAVSLALAAFGLYLVRGDGPSTKSVEARLALEREAARAATEAEHQRAMTAAQNPGVQHHTTTSFHSEAAEAARIAAIANPETAAALQNLQKLLYSRAITDDEYLRAKRSLLGE